MAVFRQVHVDFWQDAFVLDLTPEEKYFYLYLMTNSKTSQCGIYELPTRIIETETGYNRETVEKLLQRFIQYGKIYYDDSTKEIMIKNWIKYNKINSPKVKSCILKELENVKNQDFVKEFYKLCERYGYSIDTLSKDYGEEKEKEKEKEEEEEKEKEQEKEGKKEEPKTPKKRNQSKENLCSIEDIEAFVESQMTSNPLPVSKKLLVKYIDCLRLYRKTARISASIIKNLWQKWSKFPQAVITYAMWIHIEKHDDKKEEYTLGIMRQTTEQEANQKLRLMISKANTNKEGYNYDATSTTGTKRDEEPDKWERYYV